MQEEINKEITGEEETAEKKPEEQPEEQPEDRPEEQPAEQAETLPGEQPEELLPKRKLTAYYVWGGIGLAFALFVMYNRGIFSAPDSKTVIRDLSDGFTVSGMVMLCIGMLILVSQKGAFDAISFAFGSLVSMFKKDAVLSEKYRTYSNYKQQKMDKDRIRTSVLLVPGLILTVLGIILTIVYMNIK